MEVNVLHAPVILDMSGEPLELVSPLSGLANGATIKNGTRLVERRRRVRTGLHLPVLMFRHGAGDAVETNTRDLSSDGFYCVSRVQFEVGERLLCSLKIPTHDPNGQHLERNLECTVRVMRVVPQKSGDLFGIACRIEDYHISPTGPVRP
jgi:PilZ domain